MNKSLNELSVAQAARISSVLTDVDGVHTKREGGVSICELISEDGIKTFTEVDGTLVRAFIPCDLNGVPENGTVRVLAGRLGDKVFELYRFNIPAGQAVKDLVAHDLPVRFLSGRDSPSVRARARALGAEPLLGVSEKYKCLKNQGRFDPSSILVVSDNMVDADLLHAVREAGGISVAPADAEPEALEAAEYVTKAKGGEGVIAEITRALFLARS